MEGAPVIARLSRWSREWWLSVPIPRELSTAFALLYLVAFTTGLVTLVSPPVTLSERVGGPHVMAAVGVMLSLGAVMSMVGGYREHWKLERVGLSLMACALVSYALTVAGLHFTTPGSRLTQLGVVGMALISLGIRYLMIWRFSYRPRG